MDGGFPLVMLIGPLLGGALAFVARGRQRLAAAVGLVSVALLALLLWLAAPGGNLFGDSTAVFYGRELTLSSFARALFLLIYSGLGGLFALAWFRPVGGALVPAGLAALSPLAAGVMISQPGLGAVFILVAAAVLVPALHDGRYATAGAAWRYFLFAAIALAPALLAVSLPATVSASSGWVPLLLAAIILMGGFPFHVWSAPLGRAASPASLALALGLAQLATIAILMAMLDGAPAARSLAEFQTAIRWSAALTALTGAFFILRASKLREAIAGVLVLDMGFLLPATLLPGADGLLLALPALISRYLGLLLIAAAWRARVVADNDARFASARSALPAAMLAYGLLTLLGLPLTPGFSARWSQLVVAGQGDGHWAAFLLAAALAVGAFGLLRGLAHLASAEEITFAGGSPAAWAESGLMALLLAAAVLCGVWPNLLTAVVSRMLGLG